MPQSERTVAGRWWRFVATGVLINGALFALLWLLLQLGLDYRLAATLSFVTGVLWGYIQNRLWSWKSDVPVLRSTLRYFAAYGIIFVVHMSLVVAMVQGLGWHPVLASIVSVALLVVPNFLLMNAFVFRKLQAK